MAITAKIYNEAGAESGAVELNGKIFGAAKPRTGLLHSVVTALLANQRAPLAATKTKGMVRGGGKKPWQQKGTGRARAGSIRSPLWRGGGVIFGPSAERNFKQKINSRAKRLGLLAVLSDRAAENRVLVLDSWTSGAGKTKAAAEKLAVLRKNFPSQGRNVLLVIPSKRPEIIRAIRNLPYVRAAVCDSLNLLDALWADQIIFLRETLPTIEKIYVK